MPSIPNWFLPGSQTPNIMPWGQYRSPSQGESDALDYFVYMPDTPIHILGEQSRAFNCVAWSLGITTQVMGMDGGSGPSLQTMIKGYGDRGFRPATEASGDVAIWVQNGGVTHVSVRYNHPRLGSIWTSKLGWDSSPGSGGVAGMLISHSLEDMAKPNPERPSGSYAGTIEAYMQRGSQSFIVDEGADEDPLSPLEIASRDFIVGMQQPVVPVGGYGADPGEGPDFRFRRDSVQVQTAATRPAAPRIAPAAVESPSAPGRWRVWAGIALAALAVLAFLGKPGAAGRGGREPRSRRE